MENIRELAARRIRARREVLGLSQAEAAERADVPMRSYQRVEKPDEPLALDVLGAVARALNLNPWDIIRPDAPATPPPLDALRDLLAALATAEPDDVQVALRALNAHQEGKREARRANVLRENDRKGEKKT